MNTYLLFIIIAIIVLAIIGNILATYVALYVESNTNILVKQLVTIWLLPYLGFTIIINQNHNNYKQLKKQRANINT